MSGVRGAQPGPDTPAEGAPEGFLPARPDRGVIESVAVRLIATVGIIAIGTALGSALHAWTDLYGWLIALSVSTVSVVLAAVLWRSREL